MQIFQNVGVKINDTVGVLVNELQGGWISDLMSLASVSISLYVLVYGYMVLAGKIQTPLHDLAWNLAKFGIILTFLSNTGGYLDLSNDAIEGLKGFFAGGVNTYALLDEKVLGIIKLGSEILQDASGIKDSVLAVFRLIGLLPLILGFTAAGALLVFTEITLKILMATAPIFIFALMWGFLRDSFNNWLSAIIGNCLIILFTNSIMKFSFLLVSDVLLNTEVNGKDFLIGLVLLVVAGLLNIMAVKWGREMALNIARVSVDAGIGGGKYTDSQTAKQIGKTVGAIGKRK